MVTRTELSRIKEDFCWLYGEQPPREWLEYVANTIRKYINGTRVVNINLTPPEHLRTGNPANDVVWVVCNQQQVVKQLLNNSQFQALRQREKEEQEKQAALAKQEAIRALDEQIKKTKVWLSEQQQKSKETYYTGPELPKKLNNAPKKGGFDRFSGHWVGGKS